MLTADKIRIRKNKFVKNYMYQLVFWYLSFLFYVFISGEHQIFKIYLNLLRIENIYLVILFLSLSISFLFSFIDLIFTDRLMRSFPIVLTILARSILYFSSAFFLILAAARSPLTIYTKDNYTEILKLLPEMDINFGRFLVHFYVSCFLNNLFKGMEKRMGRSNLRSWVFGLLNKPREENRIFMFIDMKSSTTIAEKLEHKKFSHLVQDVFSDLAVVDNYKAEIYQYVGDGAILSWSLRKGLQHNNFLRAFYAFNHVIHKRRRYYQRKYDLIPQFKAGVHVGKVMVLQVGQIRRDVSYNGDTMNTAARIESMCNEYRQNLLISGDLFDIVKDPKPYNLKNVGTIKLKGKRKTTDIYQVKQKK
jgi:adenylate cyclase